MLLQLFPELREEVFSYCSINDIKSLACCCSSYSKVLRPRLWKNIYIPHKQLLENSFQQKEFKSFKFTNTLRVKGDSFHLSDAKLSKAIASNYQKIFQHCSPLTLHVTRCYIPALVVVYIGKLNSLRELDLSGTNVNDYYIHSISSSLTKLRILNVSNSSITDNGLKFLKNMTHLEETVLAGCSNLTDVGVSHTACVLTLRRLNLSCCYNITDAALSHVSVLNQLRKLDLSHCNITDQGLFLLRTLKKLEELNLTSCYGVSDTGIQNVTADIVYT